MLDPHIREEKLKEYDCLALTSHQENFGLSVTEALSVGLPVCISNKVNLSDFVIENNCGWVSTLDVGDISQTITEIFQTSRKEMHSKGINGYNAVRKDFSMYEVAQKYADLYKSAVKVYQPV